MRTFCATSQRCRLASVVYAVIELIEPDVFSI
jgi:hypothetical protein